MIKLLTMPPVLLCYFLKRKMRKICVSEHTPRRRAKQVLCSSSVTTISSVCSCGLAHGTGVHERNTVPMHETQFGGKAQIVCQTQEKARFRHVSGTGLTRFRSIFGTVYARFRHILGTLSAQLWHAVCTF